MINRCSVLGPDGVVIATTSAEAGDGSWLGTIRGKLPSRHGLFSVSDEGLVHIEVVGGSIDVGAHFVDTEGLVQSDCDLQPGASGNLYVIDSQRVMLLQIRQGETP